MTGRKVGGLGGLYVDGDLVGGWYIGGCWV